MNETTKLELLKLSVELTRLMVDNKEIVSRQQFASQNGFSIEHSAVTKAQEAVFQHLTALLADRG
ncbi:hypothetical protein ABWL39_20500 [Chitinivorax sp. PXF-14]|uniref:hypothetical protein n=1 Tax=Chitinivorax sp. PXF-14 TaxID=3230488 RepID=UPI00346595F1